MWGVPEKLMKGMTVSRVIRKVGSQSVPMGRRKTGAHYSAHFKGEGGSTSRKWPGGEACMEDQGRTDAAMLDEKGRGELYLLLISRKADGFNKGRFSNWSCPEERLSTVSNGITYENDIYFMMFSMICTLVRLPKGALIGLKDLFLVYMRGRSNINSIFENENLKRYFLTVFSELKLGVNGLISILENICKCIKVFSSFKTIENGPAICDSLSFYWTIFIQW